MSKSIDSVRNAAVEIKHRDNRQEMVNKKVNTPDGAVINVEYRAAAGIESGRVLLIHALTMNISNWAEVIPLLPAD